MSISSGPSYTEPVNTQWNLAEKNGYSEEEEVELEEEEEIDELASASEPEDDDGQEASSPGVSRQYRRVPGQTVLPAVKIENILQADGRFYITVCRRPPFNHPSRRNGEPFII